MLSFFFIWAVVLAWWLVTHLSFNKSWFQIHLGAGLYSTLFLFLVVCLSLWPLCRYNTIDFLFYYSELCSSRWKKLNTNENEISNMKVSPIPLSSSTGLAMLLVILRWTNRGFPLRNLWKKFCHKNQINWSKAAFAVRQWPNIGAHGLLWFKNS